MGVEVRADTKSWSWGGRKGGWQGGGLEAWLIGSGVDMHIIIVVAVLVIIGIGDFGGGLVRIAACKTGG